MANYNLREVLKQLGRNILSWVKTNCVNNCVSTTTNLPLAAAQGTALQKQITTLNSNITHFTDKDKLGSCTTGTISFDATQYKYVYVVSIGGATLIPVPLLRFLAVMPISHVRYVSSDYNASLYMQLAINKLTINNYNTVGWSKTEVIVHGIR